MKNILNHLTEEEKNNIRKQHSIKLVSEQISTEPNNKLKTENEGMLKSCNPNALKNIKSAFFGESTQSIKIENNVSFGEGAGAKGILFITAQGQDPCWCRKEEFQKL